MRRGQDGIGKMAATVVTSLGRNGEKICEQISLLLSPDIDGNLRFIPPKSSFNRVGQDLPPTRPDCPRYTGKQSIQTDQEGVSRGVNISKSSADLGSNLDPNRSTPGLPLPVSKRCPAGKS